jgi:hypothetical protein
MKKTILLSLVILIASGGLSVLILAINRKRELQNRKWYAHRTESAVFAFIPLNIWNDSHLSSLEYTSAKKLEDNGLMAIVATPASGKKLKDIYGDPAYFETLEAFEKFWNQKTT